MAKQLIETLTDDLDGSPAVGTVAFTVNGTHYEIELSKKNSVAFDKAVAPYIGAARKVRGPAAAARSSRSRPGGKRTDLGDIRAWARDHGYEVSERGRVATEVVDAYDAAH